MKLTVEFVIKLFTHDYFVIPVSSYLTFIFFGKTILRCMVAIRGHKFKCSKAKPVD